ADEIVFDPIVFATPQTIIMNRGLRSSSIMDDLSIVGPGADKLTVSGNLDGRGGFVIDRGTIVSMSGLTIADGLSQFGGVIENRGGTLMVDRCAFSDNEGLGGAMVNGGVITISNSTFSGNLSYRGNGAA